MEVIFRTNRLRRNYAEAARAIRQWGPVVGRRYIIRVTELYNIADFQGAVDIRSLRLHPLRGPNEGKWAIDLTGSWRLIVTKGATEETVIIEEVSNHYDD